MTDERENVYDRHAQVYADNNERGAFNARYERPAMLALLGDVAGLRVLDAGCGPGALSHALAGRGARVTGIDASAELLALASRRLDGAADLRQADLNQPLPFGDNQFDVVASSLVMHYLEDWSGPLKEFHRVLAPNGRLVFSTHHPTMDHLLSGRPNYFETYEFSDEWHFAGTVMKMRFWHRPLRAMTQALSAAGFRIDVIDEPEPEKSLRESDPVAWELITTRPQFLFFSATRA